MSRIALVQSYPYEAVSGGDAAYIDALHKYLISRGHDVYGMVTDIMRGRTLPYYATAYTLNASSAWKVRRSIRVGKYFISYDPRLWVNSVLKVFLGKSLETDKARWGALEASWVQRELNRRACDAVILIFGASIFAPFLEKKLKTISLIGFLSEVPVTLQDISEGHPLEQDTKLDETSHLDMKSCIALNNMADVVRLRKHGFSDVFQVNMGFRPKPVSGGLVDPAAPIVIMVGAYTTANAESCSWFLDEVWPIILRERPDARLRLVGRIASLVTSKTYDAVEPVGFVPDLETEYRSAQVVVAPLVIGSRGVKIKVAEALSYGCALVTTSLGIDTGSDDQFAGTVDVADTPQGFAAAVLALLNDAGLRKVRQERALHAFERNFSYHAAYDELSRRLEA